MTSRRTAVLGAGISGLAAAHRLALAGCDVRVFEGSNRTGGVVGTETEGPWRFERGPNSLQESPEVARLIASLGLEAERIEAPAGAARRFLARGGELVALPRSPREFLGSRLFSARTKFALLCERFRRPPVDRPDVSLAGFVREHFGEQMLQTVAQPFVSGVYAGDPERLSARWAFPRLWEMERHYGSLVKGQIRAARERRDSGLPAIPALVSFRGGLQTLTDRLAASLPADGLALGAQVEGLVAERAGGWTVVGRRAGVAFHETGFDTVVTALPAFKLAEVSVGENGERPFEFLRWIPHPPVMSLFAGFRREEVGHPLDGFGFLVPAKEKRPLLGVIFCTSLFPGRAPAGHVGLGVMIGGMLQPETALHRTPQEAWTAVRPHLRQLLGITGEPAFLRSTFWPEAIPQYELGYSRILDRIEQLERDRPGLQVLGNFRNGISVPDCLIAASRVVVP